MYILKFQLAQTKGKEENSQYLAVKIRIKLVIMFFLVALIGGIIGYAGFVGVNEIFEITNVIADETTHELILLGEVDSFSHALQAAALGHYVIVILEHEEHEEHEEFEEFEEINSKLDKTLDQLKLLEKEGHLEEELVKEEGLLKQLIIAKSELYHASLKFIEMSDADINSQTIFSLKEELEQAKENMNNMISQRINHEKAELEERDTAAEQISVDISNFIVVVTFFGIIFALSLGFVISESISKPITKLRNALEEIDRGNYETEVVPQGDDETKKMIRTFNDMTKGLKKTIELEKELAIEKERRKKEKLAIIGEIASRMSHDLRNPLAIIKISLENMRALYGTDETKQAHFDKINRSIDRINHQIDGVMDSVKERPVELSKVMMSEILAESLDSLVIPDNIKLVLPKNDVELFCDKSQFLIVMNNLILNGIQAIDGVGTIEISVEENNDAKIIQIRNSGKEIPKEELDKIFEPLFTTKMEGTGLGLVSVKAIIDAHNGTISVTSPPVVFTITLPKINY